MKKSKHEKDNLLLRDLLYKLSHAAERVSREYGTHDNGTPSDYTEWHDLRVSIQNARTKGNISPYL